MIVEASNIGAVAGIVSMAAAMTLKRSHSRSFAGQLGIADTVVAERACKLQNCWHGNIVGCRCMDCLGIAYTIEGLSQRCETQHREHLSEMRSKRQHLAAFDPTDFQYEDCDGHIRNSKDDDDSIPELDGIVADVDVSPGAAEPSMHDATLDGVLLELMKRYQESAGPDHRWTEEGIERFVDSLLGEEDASSSAEFHQLSYASLDEHVDTELGAMVREITLCHICGFNAEHCVCNHD